MWMTDNPSEKLFETIKTQGLSYLDSAISEKTTENYYLDFKTTESEDYTGKRKLLASDRKNYAKAISAFGNSEGGVIIWGIKTGTSDADYAIGKIAIKNVSNFASLLQGFTSMLTIPQHSSVSHQIIFENEAIDSGYVITHIPKSYRRPFQVINENDFRYYIRAGSNSLPASDTFLRSLFGQEPQSNVFITFGVGTPITKEDGTIEIKVGVILHNGGENVGRNVNGYVLVGGEGVALQIHTPNEFAYSKNSIAGLKMGFMAKPDFMLGVEQEVQPLIMHIHLKKPVPEYGIQVIALVNGANQISHRIHREISSEDLEKAYDSYMQDHGFDIVNAIIGPEKDVG